MSGSPLPYPLIHLVEQERTRGKVPPEVRRRQVALEMGSAKQAAANAKAARECVCVCVLMGGSCVVS